MAYTYYNIYIDNLAKSPKTDYHEEMQEFVDDMFYDSSDWYTIEEEASFASGVYSDLDVRINHVVNATTGLNQGDDWKKLIFQDIDKSVRIGALFQFSNNYWVTVNTGATNNLTSTCTVRRCNNTLRWIDVDGARHKIPCVLDYRISENRNYATGGSKFVNPSGLLEVITQLNTNTNLIVANDRFLFGNSSNWTGYMVNGGGIHNFNNPESTTINTTGMLKLTMSVYQMNLEVDDIVDGYANATERLYTIVLDKSSISGIVTDTFQLDADVFLNGESVTRTVEWASSDTNIATVSNGLVTFVALGSATITASLEGDATITDACAVTVNTTPISEYVVVFTPDTNFLLEGITESYVVTLEKNGVTQGDTFTFAIVAGSVPVANYTFTSIDGNNFSVENIEKYPAESLIVRATSGIYVKDLSILLRGAW